MFKSLVVVSAILLSTTISSAGVTRLDPGTVPMSIRHINGKLYANGVIDESSFEQLAAMASVGDLTGKTIVLNSNGGNVQAAIDFGRLIRTLGMNTAVERRSFCASSCAMIVFPAGVKRTAALSAQMMVHQIYIRSVKGDVKSEAKYNGYQMDLVQQDLGKIATYLSDMGISGKFLGMALSTPPWDPMRELTRQEMIDVGLLN
jgi:hypothetical protein